MPGRSVNSRDWYRWFEHIFDRFVGVRKIPSAIHRQQPPLYVQLFIMIFLTEQNLVFFLPEKQQTFRILPHFLFSKDLPLLSGLKNRRSRSPIRVLKNKKKKFFFFFSFLMIFQSKKGHGVRFNFESSMVLISCIFQPLFGIFCRFSNAHMTAGCIPFLTSGLFFFPFLCVRVFYGCTKQGVSVYCFSSCRHFPLPLHFLFIFSCLCYCCNTVMHNRERAAFFSCQDF